MIRRLADPRREEGAILVLFAVLIFVFCAMVAVVIDLGALRDDSRGDRTIADFAATAGAAELDASFGGSQYRACQSAWGYFAANALGGNVPPDPCGSFTPPAPCGMGFAVVPRTVAGTAGPYTVSITMPIPDDSPYLQSRLDPVVDGSPCERIAVEVRRSREFAFANTMKAAAGSSVQLAVARAAARNSTGEAVSLIILDPTGCKALLAKGQAQVIVKGAGDLPGIIQVDSAGTYTGGPQERSCAGGSDYAIDATGEQNAGIQAGAGITQYGETISGVIYSYALTQGQGNTHSYDPSDIPAERIKPAPRPGVRVTRQPFDWRYNCQSANSCPSTQTRPPYIDNLRAAIGTSGVPTGYSLYPGACKTLPNDPVVVMPPGNWFVDCANFDVASSVTFQSGSVVFKGSVKVGASGVLTVNASGTNDSTAYFRSGNFTKDAQAAIFFNRTLVYLDNGVISLGAGSGAVSWSAPIGGAFEDLSLWSESSGTHELGGQAALNIEGIFFTPNAFPFLFTGQGAQYQTKAQFVVHRLEVTGQGSLVMQPDPDRILRIPMLGVTLLR